jgi:hypothetical protein
MDKRQKEFVSYEPQPVQPLRVPPVKTVKPISLGLPTPFRIVEHVDMQACGEIRHSRLPACSGIPWDFIVAYTLDARADGDVVEFRFSVWRTPTWWSSSPASSMTDGYCELSAEKTSIDRTGVNITSGI